MRVPSSTPAGILTCRVFSRRTRPLPEQVRQGFSITRPAPWQLVQVRSTVKKPCCARMRPRPWQVWQVTGLEPGAAPMPLQSSHDTEVGTRMRASDPAKASSSDISRL